MSHFIVAVITKEVGKLEEILAPYDENLSTNENYNPNSKWDWYEIGGRWINSLLVKKDIKDEECIYGRPGLGSGSELNKEAPEGYKWTDGAKIKNINFEKMMEGSYERACRFWELKVEGKEPQTEEEKNQIEWDLYKKEYYTERYETKENYAEICSKFYTWALVDENGWHEQGKMGWWAMDDSTKETEKAFVEKFQEYITNPENQEKYLIMVDCHI